MNRNAEMGGVPREQNHHMRRYFIQQNISGVISWRFLILLVLLSLPLAGALSILTPQENASYNDTTIAVTYLTSSSTCHASAESATGGGPLLLPDIGACHDFVYNASSGWNSLILSDGLETRSVNFYIGNRLASNGSSLPLGNPNSSNNSAVGSNITYNNDGGTLGVISQNISPGSSDTASSFSHPNEPGRLRLATGDGQLVNAHLSWRRGGAIISEGDIGTFDPASLPAGTYDVEVAVPGRSLRTLRFTNIHYDPALAAGIEELDPGQVSGTLPPLTIDAFAVDPSSLSFSSGSLTFVAEGNALYKCAAYDFAARTCSGPNVKLLDTIPGREYTIPLTPGDPLFTQTGYLTNPTFDTNTNGWTTLNELNTVTYSAPAAQGDPLPRCAQMQGQASVVSIGNYYQAFNLTIPNGTSLQQVNFSFHIAFSTYIRTANLSFMVQDAGRTNTYCRYDRNITAILGWTTIQIATRDNCSQSNFAANTNYTVRLRCALNSSAGSREVCRWDTINVTATYLDTPPVFNTHLITPSLPFKNATLNCSVNVSDSESSQIPVNFTWWENGVQNMSMNASVMCANSSLCYDSVAVGPGNLTPTDVWTCNATAYPGLLQTNSSVSVTIQNRLPAVNVSAPSVAVTLNAGSTVVVQCNVSVTDPDNSSTINSTNATMYLNGTSAVASDSNVSHYTNTSCVTTGSSLITKNYTCNFTVLYYASNGTWWCNVTANDTWNLTNNASIFTIDPLFALNITPVTLDFGKVPIGSISANQSVTIANIGNQAMNVSTYGYGAAPGDGNSFTCAPLNLSITLLRFSNFVAANYTQKLNLSSAPQPLNLTIPAQNDPNLKQNATYWQVSVPQLFNDIGPCTGTLVFQAETP
jgi:hypothetical protein